MKNIKENNRGNARRLLHCLAVAVRPLRVEELAEILTFDFDTTEGGIPRFDADRRPNDQEEAVLSLCSSLITVVDNQGSRMVQFSHFSVKEFLTSNHLASSAGHLTSYHILPRLAHTILAQVCLGLLLHSPADGSKDNERFKGSPLAEYAARHWFAHAQSEGVTSSVEGGMRSLFDPGRPHFAAWIALYDMDAESGGKLPSGIPSPLYYSSLCGLPGLVRHIAMNHPEHVNAVGGSLGFPLVAALCRNHLAVAKLLLEHGGRVDVRDTRQQTVLHETFDRHGKVSIDAVRFLLERGADVNARRDDLCTPLHLAINTGEFSVIRLLLDRHAGVNSRNNAGRAPLHLLCTQATSQDRDDGSDIAKLLLERGANVDEKDEDNATPLHLASYNKRLKIIRVLLDHGANVDAEKDRGETPLQLAISKGSHDAQEGGVGVAFLLLEHGAQLYSRDKYHISTSDLAYFAWKEKIGPMLVGTGGNLKPENNQDQTAFRPWVEGEYYCMNLVSGCHAFFVESGADGNVQAKYDTILLHSASYHGRLEMVRMLLSNGVNSNAKNHRGETALHVLSRCGPDSKDSVRVARLLLECGVDVNMQDNDHDSPLHSASYNGKLEIVRELLNHGANASAKNKRDEVPLHQGSQGEYESQADGVRIAQLLLDRGVDVNARDKNGATPLHLASWCGKLEIAQLLVEHANSKINKVRTLLHALEGEYYPQELNCIDYSHLF